MAFEIAPKKRKIKHPQAEGEALSYYPLYDGHGSVIALSDNDGVITDTYDYTPYGKIRNSTGSTSNPYQYSGERTDSETGFQYLRARYYNTESGRFTTRDTWAGVDGSPVTLNKYLYGNGNPVRYVDPSGHFPTITDLNIGMMVQVVLNSITTLKVYGFLSTAVQTVWGIPWSEDAFKNSIAKMDGISFSGGALNVGAGGGIERLIPNNSSENWYYKYLGASFSLGFSYGLPVSLDLYTGEIFDNRKNKSQEINIKSYLGAFYTISTSAVTTIFARAGNSLPFGAMIFSSGQGGGLYGYAENIGIGSFDISVSGAWSYYYEIGAGKSLWDASPLFSSEKWDESISKRLGGF